MMKYISRRIRRPAALGVAVLLFAAMPATALAQSDEDTATPDRTATDRPIDDRPHRDRDLDTVKERILKAIDERLEALNRMSEAVAENEYVTASHAAHLQNDYRAATRNLEEAADDVANAESFAELRAIVPAVFEHTLVFALLKPKTHLVVGSDTMVAISERMEVFAEMLQMVIDRLSDEGFETGAAQGSLDEMARLLESAKDIAGPVADNVIGLDPEDWPDPAKAALEQARADLKKARELLGAARGQAHETVNAIREALSS